MIWIRTQDKKMLVEVSGVLIQEREDKCVIFYLRDCKKSELGEYSSLDICMKIVDSIQTMIYNKECDRLYSRNYTEADGANNVFEMPIE